VTRQHGIPLIFDEVVTGFRFAYGGAQEYYGVTPDLAALGKIVGGGFPLAAVCGRQDIMRCFDPRNEGTSTHVAQVGTLSGNPVAAVAGLATLAELRKPGTYERLRKTGNALRDGLADAARRAGVPAQVVGEPAVFDIFFTDRPVVDYRSTLTADGARLRAFNERCLERGVLKPTHKIYVSLAHDDRDVDRTLDVFRTALAR
jgi:glutamate-1-semialdehyde 2,1-aminomutase